MADDWSHSARYTSHGLMGTAYPSISVHFIGLLDQNRVMTLQICRVLQGSIMRPKKIGGFRGVSKLTASYPFPNFFSRGTPERAGSPVSRRNVADRRTGWLLGPFIPDAQNSKPPSWPTIGRWVWVKTHAIPCTIAGMYGCSSSPNMVFHRFWSILI